MAAILYSAIMDSAICTKLWLKLVQSDSNSFILTQIDDGSHLEFCLPRFSHFAQKELYSFILTQLDDISHLEFFHLWIKHCHLGFLHFVIFSQIHSKTLSLHSDSDSNYFNLTQTHSFSLNLMMAVILNVAILDWAMLVFPLKLTHTFQDWFKLFAQKKFTCSFWLNLMMAAILNLAILDSDTAILDSNTLLSSLRLTQKHSSSNLTLAQTNSIWLT